MLDRSPLLADASLTGARWCERHSALVDEWLASLLGAAVEADRGAEAVGVAIVAVGGYGRSELCPQSDLDVMLLRSPRRDVTRISERIWYPIWDAGMKLGHSVCTQREALAIAENDLDTATALLSARHIAGDATLTHSLHDAAHAHWERRSKRWLEELGARVDARHAQAGEVAFTLEPDLKEGRGGLRDVHSLHWAQAARNILIEHDEASLAAAYATLLDARVELHRRTERTSNVLALQEQDAVAAALRLTDGDALMAGVAAAARAIAWTSDDAWRRIRSALRGPSGRSAKRDQPLADGVVLRSGEVHLAADADLALDPVLALRAAQQAAAHETVIDRGSLERLAERATPMPDPWPDGAREILVGLLLCGAAAIPVIEALDHRGVWVRILPEWEPVRSRPQRNSYHRFTVDRHLLETISYAATLAGRVERPDLLVMSALLHDLGKGTADDHTGAGVEIARRIGSRIGFPQPDVDVVAELVANHLLLSEVAVRRDLDDPATIQRVATRISSTEALHLLTALTEADSRATGPAAWGPSKSRLIALLASRVAKLMGDDVDEVAVLEFPSEAHRALLASADTHIAAGGELVTVVTDDRPGIFCKIAGVLAFHGLDVVSASAYSAGGRALSEFGVSDPFRPETPWPRVERDLALALDGRLAVQARVAERSRTYDKRSGAWRVANAVVRFDNDASDTATVIDVHTVDAVGVLYRITRALMEFDVDIRSARVQTLGAQVVDAFYVVDHQGAKITSAETTAEIERAIVHALNTT